MITKYGYDVYFTVVALCIVVVVLSFLFVEAKTLRISFIAVAVVFFGFSTNFFRDPDRTTPSGDHLVVSPADGKVILIKQVNQPEYLSSDATQISIFMSPLNVHVNRNPITGTVRHTRYVKGEYFAAYADKASEKNEQMVVGIENTYGKVLFKQIAGVVARRIVCELKPGDSVKAGGRFGMIKFGSRVDIFVPRNTAVKVHVGDVAVAGETVLAVYDSASH